MSKVLLLRQRVTIIRDLLFLSLNLFLLVQLATLTGHTFRVLYLAISPDGQVVHSSLLLIILVLFC